MQADRLETARDFADGIARTLALKGAGTVVAAPDGRVCINPTGNPGMATGGSGDALTGMAGAFLARGLAPLAASRRRVPARAAPATSPRDRVGEEGLIAGDIVEAIAAA